MSRLRVGFLRPRLVAAVGALVLGAATLSGAVAASSSDPPAPRAGTATDPATLAPAGTGSANPVSATARRRLPPRSTVTLATGHRVRLDAAPGGPPSVTVLPTHSEGDDQPEQATFTQLQWAGDTYVVPNVALPYLDVLDIRLFNVSYLASVKLDDKHSSTLPVTIAYRQQRPTRVPGVQADEPSNRKAAGQIVKGEALKLGQLLATRWQKAESGRSASSVGELDGIARLELAPKSGSAATLPTAPTMLSPGTARQSSATGPAYHTVSFNPIASDGDAGHAIGFVQNVDDAQLSPSGIELGFFIAGGGYPTSYSLPEGTYSVTTTVVDGPVGDYSVKSSFVAEPEVSIDADTTIDLDAREAVPFVTTLEPPLETPEYRQDMLTFTRTSEQGGERSVQATPGGIISMIVMRMWSFPGSDINDNGILSATPTGPVTTGSFGFAGYTQLAQDPTDTAAMRPTYKLAFPTEGRIPDSLTYSVGESDLTTVRTELYGTKPISNHIVDLYLPWGPSRLGVEPPVLFPGEHIDYWYSSEPDITLWQDFVTREEATDPRPHYIRIYGQRRVIEPGDTISQEWHKGPLVPSPVAPFLYTVSFSVNLLGGALGDIPVEDPRAKICTACRQDNNGMVYIAPFGDSDPTHYGRIGDDATSATAFYRNGKLAFDWPAIEPGLYYVAPYALDLPLLSEPASYRLDWTWTENRDPALSTTTRWRFHSGPDDAAADLPENVLCGPDTSRDCSLLPLLFVNYDLDLTHGLTAPAGLPFELAFRVGRQEYAPAPSGLEATVSVSYDDGQTWTEPGAATSQGDGRFALSIQHPPLSETSGHVSLRVQAHDAAGNSVEQELIHAYALHGQ